MKSRQRTWITKYKEQQGDILRLTLMMALIFSFHIILRELMIFSMLTLRVPYKLSVVQENLPYTVMNGVVMVCVLLVVVATIHFIGVFKKRLAIRVIALSLIVSSCGLTINAGILREILRMGDPILAVGLHPNTLIVDLNRYGWLQVGHSQITKAGLTQIMGERLKKYGEHPLVVRVEDRAQCRNLDVVIKMSLEQGYNDISLAVEWGLDYYKVKPISELPSPEVMKAENISSFMIYIGMQHAGGYVVNGNKVEKGALSTVLADLIEKEGTRGFVIKITDDAPYRSLRRALEACKSHGITNIMLYPLN